MDASTMSGFLIRHGSSARYLPKWPGRKLFVFALASTDKRPALGPMYCSDTNMVLRFATRPTQLWLSSSPSRVPVADPPRPIVPIALLSLLSGRFLRRLGT